MEAGESASISFSDGFVETGFVVTPLTLPVFLFFLASIESLGCVCVGNHASPSHELRNLPRSFFFLHDPLLVIDIEVIIAGVVCSARQHPKHGRE